MGGGKPKRNNYRHQNHPKTKVTYEVQQPIDKEKLLDEAYQAMILLGQSQQNLKIGKEKYCYVISLDWFVDWQEYVGYKEVEKQKEPDSKHFGKKKPGKINTDIVSKDNDDFIFIPEQFPESVYLNCIMSDKFEGDIDAKVVDLETWNFFVEKYEGIEVRRPIHYIKDKVQYDIDFKQPHFIILDDQLISQLQSMNENQIKKQKNILNRKRLQIPKYWRLSNILDLFQKIIDLQQKEKNEQDKKVIRIWKIDGSLTSTQLNHGIVQSITKKSYKIKGEVMEIDQYIQFYSSDYIRNQYNYCIEIKNEGQEWIFSPSEKGIGPVQDAKGFCEWCEEEEKLTISCLCKKVYYCGYYCKYKDQDFHSHLCPIAFDSEGEEELYQIEVDKKGKCGLGNIGNTCYMNSALQSLMHCPDFADFYCKNKFKQYLKDDAKKSHQLTLKFSKMVKTVFLEMQASYEPHAVKSQISILNPAFKGKDQHDSCEFIIFLINFLDDQLKPFSDVQQQQNEEEEVKEEAKQQMMVMDKDGNEILQIQENQQQDPLKTWKQLLSKSFSPLLINTFLGLFQSYITCPKCESYSIQYDSFTIFSVPIKFKPLIKGLQIFVVLKDLNKPILSHFLEYKQDEDTIYSAVNEIAKIFKLNAAYLLPTIATTEVIEQTFTSEQSLQKKLHQIDNDISRSNKNLVLYELSDIIQQNEKIIGLQYFQNQPVPGTKDYDQKVNISIPRPVIFSEDSPIAQLYCIILSMFQAEYADMMKFVEEEMYKQDDDDQNEEQQEEEKEEKNSKHKLQNGDKNGADSNKRQKKKEEEEIEEQKNQLQNKADTIYINMPFKINIISEKKKKKRGKGSCQFCGKNCDTCCLPFDKTKTFKEFIDKYDGPFSLEIFWDRDKPIPKPIQKYKDFIQSGNEEGQQDNKKKDLKKSNCPSISECLQYFSEPEQLSEDNAWYCQTCKEYQQAFKSMQVYYAPKYLILQIKRFKADAKGNKQKNSQQIMYDEILDFTGICKNKSPQLKPALENDLILYNLIAVIIHEGTLENGHYYAYCKEGQEWIEFNDDKVTVITKDKVLDNKGAYILFYEMLQ